MPDSLLVALGGGFGAWLRYAVGRWATQYEAAHEFPWHTFGINVLGSFVLGLLAVWCKDRPDRLGWLAFLGAGVCGGFTTFSAFSVETLSLIERDRLWSATGYAVGSVVAGLLAAALAIRLARSG